jgi:ATP-binding cassette subfamily F protein 3
MTLLQVQQGSKAFGAKVLLQDIVFAVNAGEHIGVIGPNGAGKTTLFKILVGQDELDKGTITRAQALRVGYLEQESEWSLDQTSEEYLTENCIKPIWELKQLGRDLGLSQDHFASPLRKLSGGYRMRMKLLYLVGQEPNLMLLDEPTNFLDLESVLALERFLQAYGGAFLLISHDREFLKRTTEYTLEVEGGDVVKFPGHVDDYFEQKAQLRATLEAQATNVALKRKHILDFVTRFGAKATKAKQAQSRLKQLDRLESIEIKDLPVRARITIPKPTHTGREVLGLDSADVGYGERTILSRVNLRLERGDHVGVVGVNGAGKSTLLKSLAGEISVLSGERRVGYQVSLSYFSQHSADQLNPDETVLQALQRAAQKDVTAQEILNMAGSLLFSGDDTQKPVRVLSGGEKTRVALGQILLMRSPLLLMDEPTNHLDFDTVEALTEALRDYAGSVVVVSHDRSFIRRVASRILEIRDGRVELYPGSYDEYVWSVQKGALSERAPSTYVESASASFSESASSPNQDAAASAPSATPAKVSGQQRRDLQARMKQDERMVRKCEEQIAKLETERTALNEKLLQAKGEEAAQLARSLGFVSVDIDRLENEMLEHMESLEQIKAQLI